MVVSARFDFDFDLDAPEEGRGGMEDESVGPRRDVRQLADPPVVVGLAFGDQVVATEELHAHTRGRNASFGVEDVG